MSEGKLNKGSFSHGGASALMIHGIQGTSSSWEKVVASCHSKVLFTLPDLRGRGDAFRGKDVRDYTLSAYVSDLKQAMSVIGNSNRSPFFLIGWSMGVSIILEYLSKNRGKKPQGLILISGSPSLSSTSWFSSQGDQLMREVDERERILGLQHAADHQAVAWTWEAIRHTDHRLSLSEIDIPTLIIHGSDDQDSPLEHARWMHEGISHSELHVIEGGGHMLLSKNPEAVAQKIDDFISLNSRNGEAS